MNNKSTNQKPIDEQSDLASELFSSTFINLLPVFFDQALRITVELSIRSLTNEDLPPALKREIVRLWSAHFVAVMEAADKPLDLQLERFDLDE